MAVTEKVDITPVKFGEKHEPHMRGCELEITITNEKFSYHIFDCCHPERMWQLRAKRKGLQWQEMKIWSSFYDGDFEFSSRVGNIWKVEIALLETKIEKGCIQCKHAQSNLILIDREHSTIDAESDVESMIQQVDERYAQAMSSMKVWVDTFKEIYQDPFKKRRYPKKYSGPRPEITRLELLVST